MIETIETTRLPTHEEICAILTAHKHALREKYLVVSLGLFGSFARGDAEQDSDIDLLVDVDPKIGLKFVHLADYLESILGRKVDLVSRNAVSKRLLPSIEEDLILV